MVDFNYLPSSTGELKPGVLVATKKVDVKKSTTLKTETSIWHFVGMADVLARSNACLMFVYLKLSWSVLVASAFSPEFSENMSIQWGSAFLQFHLSWICWGFNRLVWPRLPVVFVSLIQAISTSGRKSLSKLLRSPSLLRNRCFVGKTTLQVKPALGNYIYLCIYIFMLYIYMGARCTFLVPPPPPHPHGMVPHSTSSNSSSTSTSTT